MDISAPVDVDNYSCKVLPCSEGDVFFITAKGAAQYRPWYFLSSASENNIISRAVAGSNNYYYQNERVTAPESSAYIVINAFVSDFYDRKVWKGDHLINIVQNLMTSSETEINEINSHVNTIQSTNDLILTNIGIEIATGWNENCYFNIPTSITTIDPEIDVHELQGYSCLILECEPGDTFYVTSKGASGARNWAFLDSATGTSNIISRAVAGSNSYRYTNMKVVAPTGAKRVIFNAYAIDTDRQVIIGEYIIEKVNKIENVTNEVSILFIGNSLTQDGIAYLPYVLRHYYPEVKFRFYMWYMGGHTLAEHYQTFTNNQTCSIFSVADNTDAWTNYTNSITMESILETYEFDIVCMQGYYNYTPETNPAESTDNITAWNNCQNYILSNYTGGNSLEFISLFHAPLRSDADTVYARTKEWNAKFLQETIAQDMLPNGIAVYRALSTTLDNLGDMGHLSPDGTHAQEGLPCLMQTYTNVCWLLDHLSISKSIYGCPLRITNEIYNSINVPGPNLGSGVITGTDAENLLAQEIAIKAYKEGKYFVNKNIFKET